MFRKPGRAALASLAVALVAGWVILGHYLGKLPIGLDDSAYAGGALTRRWLPGLPPGVPQFALWVLAIGALAFFWVRGALRARARAVDPGRRSFLAGAGGGAGAALGAAAVAVAAGAARGLFALGSGHVGWDRIGSTIGSSRGIVVTAPEWKQEWKGSRVRAHRRLGRTNWQVSDIVLGTAHIEGERGEQVARLAMERGVNYFDTSPDYSGAGSEQAMGRAMRGHRDQMFVATKWCTPRGHLPPGTPVAKYIEAVEASLSRLMTDYVDLVHVHSCDEVERLLDPNVHEAFDRLKQQGKVRFLGVSSHTPNLVQVANAAIDSGRFDVIMLAYHHGNWPGFDGILARARREQDMGVVAMKTLKGARQNGLAGFRNESRSYAQAALRWTLSNPDVSCAVISFFELQHVDEYLSASGQAPTRKDLAVLERYDDLIRGSYCRPHCGECLDSCPMQLPIHDVLRYRMYFEDYGRQKDGMRLYAKLATNASVCASCPAPCLGACPVGIPIQQRMREAHDMLTLS